MIRAALLALLLATPVVAQDPVTNYADNDAAMNEAIAEAQATLPLFLANAVDAKGDSLYGTGVKVAIPTVQRVGFEHIWVTPFRLQQDGTFLGQLANQPNDLGLLFEGAQVEFTQAQISDWSMSTFSGQMYGNYTSRVMFASGAFGAVPFDQLFVADPVPAEWR
jgi:uncharacterized protein YegJ (DUF2314 family)